MKKLLFVIAAGVVLSTAPARAQDLMPMPGDEPETAAPAPAADDNTAQQPVTFMSQPLSPAPGDIIPPPDDEKTASVPPSGKGGLGAYMSSVSPEVLKEFQAFDRNNDGVITFEEFSAAYPRFYPPTDDLTAAGGDFAVMDTDNNGLITLQEFATGFKKPVEQNYTMKWVPNGAHNPED